jgi:hypothetical protein
MFTRHRLSPTNKLDCPHAMGTDAFSAQQAESFHRILLLPPPSLVHHGCKPTNLRIRVGPSAARFQASRLRVRSHARACSPPAQRTAKGHAGRCAKVVEARSIAAPTSKNGWPIQARLWPRSLDSLGISALGSDAAQPPQLEWRTAFLAKEVLRFQHSKLPAVCGEAALHTS